MKLLLVLALVGYCVADNYTLLATKHCSDENGVDSGRWVCGTWDPATCKAKCDGDVFCVGYNKVGTGCQVYKNPSDGTVAGCTFDGTYTIGATLSGRPGTNSDCYVKIPSVNCVESWSTCAASCLKTLTVTTPDANGGTACSGANGATQACTGGACNVCSARLADDIHNEAPTFNPAGSSLTAANGLQLSFTVNCNYKAGSENSSGEFRIRGGAAGTTNALQAGTEGATTGDNRIVVVKNTWASAYAYADAQNMIQSSGSQTRITMMVDFHGVSRNLSDGASGSIAVQRTIDEIYSVYAMFTNTVTVENAFVFVYAAVAVEVTLVSTTALISDSWQGSVAGGANAGTVTVAIILQTAVAAPFKIVAPAASIDYDGAGAGAAVNLTSGNAPVEQGALSGECTGPYTTGTATGSQQKTGVAICRQKWLMKVAVVLATRCKLDNAKLVFGKDGGIACGSAATTSICPLNQAGVTADTDDDFTSDLTVSTSDACPAFGMTSTACGSLNTEDPSTSNTKTVFVQGDTVQLDLELGTLTSESSTQEMKSFKTYITTVGTNECDGTDCVNSYYLASTACAFSTAYTSGSCTVQCHDNLDIVLNTNDYNITPDPARSGATTSITFTATLFIFYEDITAYSYTEPFTQASANNATKKKKTLDLSTSRSSMYALLQEAETPESIMIDAEVGFGVANAEVVEESEPATEGVKPEMAIEEESSSNLVYIVVGVLLALSVGIAAVVMYMRHSKSAKKVVPVPITVEVRNASSTV